MNKSSYRNLSKITIFFITATSFYNIEYTDFPFPRNFFLSFFLFTNFTATSLLLWSVSKASLTSPKFPLCWKYEKDYKRELLSNFLKTNVLVNSLLPILQKLIFHLICLLYIQCLIVSMNQGILFPVKFLRVSLQIERHPNRLFEYCRSNRPIPFFVIYLITLNVLLEIDHF